EGEARNPRLDCGELLPIETELFADARRLDLLVERRQPAAEPDLVSEPAHARQVPDGGLRLLEARGDRSQPRLDARGFDGDQRITGSDHPVLAREHLSYRPSGPRHDFMLVDRRP